MASITEMNATPKYKGYSSEGLPARIERSVAKNEPMRAVKSPQITLFQKGTRFKLRW